MDRIEFFVAPKIIGGRDAPGPVGGRGRARMGEALRVRDLRVRRIGEDYLMTGYVEYDVHRDH